MSYGEALFILRHDSLWFGLIFSVSYVILRALQAPQH